jgi:hypothetical protein
MAIEETMAEQVIEVLSEPGLAAWLSESAQKISGKFSWDRIVEDHLKASALLVPEQAYLVEDR